MGFFPFPEKQPLLPACLLRMDINMLGNQIFEPFETRELKIITMVEMTLIVQNPTLRHFCAVE